jgi:hypothetical protein
MKMTTTSSSKATTDLNIDNFEAILLGHYQNGHSKGKGKSPPAVKFILTSPRSLSACEKLGVKPIELLPVAILRQNDEKHEESSDEQLELARQSKHCVFNLIKIDLK